MSFRAAFVGASGSFRRLKANMSTHPDAALPLRAEGVIAATSWENEGGSFPSTPQTDGERLDWVTFLALSIPVPGGTITSR